MHTRNRVIVLAASAALAGGLAVAPAATAAPVQQTSGTTATQAPQRCDEDNLCVYPRTRYRGAPNMISAGQNDPNLRGEGRAYDDPESVYNSASGDCTAYLYPRTYYRGMPVRIASDSGRSRVGTVLDHVWSVRWRGSDCPD